MHSVFFVTARRRARAYLGQTCRLGVVEVVHAVPDRLEDTRADHKQTKPFSFLTNSRSERCNANTGADEQDRLVLQKVFRCRAKRTVDHDTGKHAIEGWVRARADDLATWVLLLLAAVALLVKVAAECLGQVAREIADDANVHRDVVFLWRAARDILGHCVGGRRTGKRTW
jgi:hypothetical protein